jgi:hypothetical protein
MVREFLTIVSNQAARAIPEGIEPGMLSMSQIYPDSKPVVQRFNIGDVDGRNGMLPIAIAMAAGGPNCYLEGRTVRKTLKGNLRGGVEDTEWVFAFAVDSDGDKSMGAGDLPLVPSLIVESSTDTPDNRHYWYFLDQAVRADEGKIIGAAIKAAVGGDGDTGVITQPYRVAGTPAFVNAKKRQRKRVDSNSKLHTDNSGVRYSASQLLTAFQPKASQQEARAP